MPASQEGGDPGREGWRRSGLVCGPRRGCQEGCPATQQPGTTTPYLAPLTPYRLLNNMHKQTQVRYKMKEVLLNDKPLYERLTGLTLPVLGQDQSAEDYKAFMADHHSHARALRENLSRQRPEVCMPFPPFTSLPAPPSSSSSSLLLPPPPPPPPPPPLPHRFGPQMEEEGAFRRREEEGRPHANHSGRERA